MKKAAPRQEAAVSPPDEEHRAEEPIRGATGDTISSSLGSSASPRRKVAVVSRQDSPRQQFIIGDDVSSQQHARAASAQPFELAARAARLASMGTPPADIILQIKRVRVRESVIPFLRLNQSLNILN